MIHIPVKRITKDSVLPQRKHAYDAGWDLTARMCECNVNTDGERPRVITSVYTGLAMAIPVGYWGMLCARSSIYKTGMILANGAGILDCGFRNEIVANFYGDAEYSAGDRCCQFLLMPALTTEYDFVEVDELPPSLDGRDMGGFGSTGK